MLKELKSRSEVKVTMESSFYVLILLLLFVANFITLLVMLLNRRMRTIPNMFVGSLAISDFLLGSFACLFSFPILATSQWSFNDATCQFQGYIATTLCVASIQTLVLMAVNRYFRIVKPAKYRRFFTKKKIMVMILVSWLSSICATLPYILSGRKMVFHPSKFVCILDIVSGRVFFAVLTTVYLGPTSCVIFYCYFRILKTVRSHNNNFQATGRGNSTVNVEEIKVARTLFVIVVFFNLCWAPVLFIDLVDTFCGRWVFSREVYVVYNFLVTISSALNPFIYGVLNKNFRKEYLKVLCCRYCRSRAVVEPLAVEGRASVVTA